MEQFVDSVLLRLDGAGFKSTQLAMIRDIIFEICDYYVIMPKGNHVVCYDYLQPEGYKKFMVNKKAQGLSEKTLRQYKMILERFFRHMLKPMEEITSVSIQLYLCDLLMTGNSPRSVNNHRNILSSMFSWLFRMEYLKTNPIFSVPPIKEKKSVYEPIGPEDLEKILNALDNQRDRALIAVISGSGIRNGEACTALKSRTNVNENRFYVVGKGNKERVCFLTPRAKFELKKYLDMRTDDLPYLFVSLRKP